MSIAATLTASRTPSSVPLTSASSTFTVERGAAEESSPLVSGWSISGSINLAMTREAGALITLDAIRCPAIPGTLEDSMATDHFIGCDWGSTSFRLRLIERGTRRIVAEQSSASGVKSFSTVPATQRASHMARFFAEQIASLPEIHGAEPIIVTGMASSNVGWRELPYASAPFPLDGSRAKVERIEFPDASGRLREALLVSGVRTDDDVMRGEECALISAQALHPHARGESVFCLMAGTHPKHARLRDHTLVSFRTHLTGELFDVLSRESLLAGSVDRAALQAAPDLAEFSAGVRCARERGVSGALFQTRARHLAHNTSKTANTWFLSGMHVGAELERVVNNIADARLLLIGDSLRVTLYRTALGELGAAAIADSAITLPLADAIVAGHEQLVERLGMR